MIKPQPMRPMLARLMLVWLLAAAGAAVSVTASAQPSQAPVVHHDLAVTLDPANHRLKVRDRIRIPGAFVTAPFTLSLNADLAVQAKPDGLKLTLIRSRVPGSDPGMDRDASGVPVNVYRVEGAIPGQELVG